MAKIILYANSCKLVDEHDVEVFQDLDKELSFHIQGAQFSAAYKGYHNDRGEFITWDGRRHLLGGNGKFPAGLLPRVQEFFQKRGEDVPVIDERPKYSDSQELEIHSRLKDINKLPREYQITAMKEAVKTDRGIIRAATGAGKTLIAALITAKLGKRAIIYVIGKDLLHQLKKFFENIFQTEIGIIGDGKCEIRDINIATVWSVGQALGIKKGATLDDIRDSEKKVDPAKFRLIKEMLLDCSVHIFDECHLAACDTVQTIAQHIKPERVYGMSASPWRDDGGDLLIEAFLGRRVVDISARYLIDNGYLVEPDIRFLAPEPYHRKSGKYPTVYSKYITENDQRNSMVVKGTIRMVEQGFVPLVLFNSIKHGQILHSKLKDNLNIALLSGKDSSKQREKIKEEVETGKIQCVIASKIFDIGIDLPKLSGLVIAGAGKSSVRALQRIGRVIRPDEGKDIAAVFDFADQAPYLSKHALVRKKIYESEFKVKWPQGKRNKKES